MKRITRSKSTSDYAFSESLVTNLSGYTRLSKCPEVITAIDKIADLISNMTIHLMQNTDNGDVRITNGLSRKVDIEPCKNMTRKQWMFFLVRTLLLEGDGNALIYPEFKNGYLENLWPIPANNFYVVPERDLTKGYKIHINNKVYDPDELIHFVINPSFENPFVGQSYRIQLKDIVKTLKAAKDTKEQFMNGRYMPSLILKFEGDQEEFLTDSGRRNILNKYVGTQKAGVPWIVPETLIDIKEIKPLTLNDIAINDSVQADRELIASLLGIPAFILGVGEFSKTEYNNFIKDKILSIAKAIEQTLTRDILESPDYYFKFNIRSLYNYDLSTNGNIGGSLFDRGIMTGNEVRDMIGLSPIKGLEEPKILENYIPTNKSGDQKKLIPDDETEEDNE